MTSFDETKSTFGTFEDRAVWLINYLLPDFPAWGVLDACACAGNLGGESEIQMIQEEGQIAPNGGWGLPQWTGPRRTQFDSYCARTGRSISAMRSGYDYLFVELRGAYAKVIGEVAAAPDLAAKVTVFEQHFEMAGIPRIGSRLDYALRAEKAWAAHLATSPVKQPSVPDPQPAALAPTSPQPPAAAPGVALKGTGMANFMDPVRNEVDAVDNQIDAVIKKIDQAKNIPIVGEMVAPYLTIFDQIGAGIDTLRAVIDKLDPVATAEVAAAPAAKA